MRRKCMDTLIQWKRDPKRKPLVLQGGRQTGKTWLLREFGNRQYENTIYINLETDRPAAEYLSVPREAEEALLFLETFSNKPLCRDSTLLILDGLESVPEASGLLPAIALDYPGYHVVAAERGTLGKYDSGDVDTLRLYPLDFEEFLWANKDYGLAKDIREHFSAQEPMGKKLHEKAMAQFYLYLAIGGMPGAICEYRKEKKLLMVPDAQQKLLSLLQADIIAKAPETLARHCRNCWLSITAQLSRANGKFQYRQVVKGGTAKMYQEPLRWLIEGEFVYCSTKITGSLQDKDDTSFRLYLADTGLSSCQAGIPSYTLLSGEESPKTRAVTETYLAQTFAQNGYALFYWCSGNQAEVPFLLAKNDAHIAVDFRLNAHQKLRNLSRLQEYAEVKQKFLISSEDFQNKELYRIIPLYAAFCI